MRKILAYCLSLASFLSAGAQDISEAAAKQLVFSASKSIGIGEDEIKEAKVLAAYIDGSSNVTRVYLQQTFKDIPVYNKLVVLAFRNGLPVSNAGSFIKDLQQRTSTTELPAITQQVAVRTAFLSKKVNVLQDITIKSTKNKVANFGRLGVSEDDITAELIWTPLLDGKKLILSWQITYSPVGTSDLWMTRIDATTNQVIDENNLTVYCDWNDPNHATAHKHTANINLWKNPLPVFESQPYTSPSIVNNATYVVVPYPAESPIHPGGTPAVRANPWTMAPGNATSLKWNSDGTDYDYTRGNNAWAYHDRNNQNTPDIIRSAMSTTSPDPLTFNFVPDFTQAPTQTSPAPNQQFNITNLFYWTNLFHDLVYQYGFNEVSGNFQANNQGRGGLGNDYVRAEAQDGSGTNNANFSTPVDGSLPRMQMYLWNQTSPGRDGDVDNGVILHEFTHGISNRLTGGPAAAGCLGNQEQMGEGWSDYYGLMATQNWATALPTDGFTSPRGIGTYVLGQPITGLGIRPARYTTNMAVNNFTYANVGSVAVPHGVGFIWCTMLWDLTWKLIETDGISPNLFDASGTGGNVVALRLVTEAMKLQPCSPGFIDGRNAIIAADQLLYNGVHVCSIREAFARRGLGLNASQGSSNSVSDGTADFAIPLTLTLNESVTQVPEGANITYTNTITTCSAISNYVLTDTLPANVTYVNGGTYNAATRVVSFPVNLAAGATQTFVFTVNVNPGSYFTPVELLNDVVPGPAGNIPPTWTATTTNGSAWTVHNVRSHSAPFSYFAANAATPGESILQRNVPVAMGAAPPNLSFWHWYNTEGGWDGGVLEVSVNGGTTWADVASNFVQNGYNGNLGNGAGNPLANRAAWNGNSGGFVKSVVNMLPYANQNLLFRFRLGSDNNTAATGWNIDDILMRKVAEVYMKSNLFSNTGTLVLRADTTAEIIQSASCTPVAITTQPSNVNACSGSNAGFSVIATGTSPAYQWQISTDAGVTYTNIPGANAATYTVTGVTAAMNNNMFKVIVTNGCPSTATSTAATLAVTNAAAISQSPVSVAVCTGNTASFAVTASGTNLTYQWQVSTNGGTSFTDISGANSATYTTGAVTAAMNGNQYRVNVLSCSATPVTSAAATLTVNTAVNVSASPANVTVCAGANASFSATVTGTSPQYQWQVSTNNGTIFTDVTGATTATLNLPAVTTAMNGNQYRLKLTGTCTPTAIFSSAATLTVNALVAVATQPSAVILCAGADAVFTVGATGAGLTYQWQVSTNGGTSYSNIAGAASSTLTVAATTVAQNGNMYRVVLNGTCNSITSSSVLLTVNTPVVITAQPQNVSICSGNIATFAISATGTSITYQWQVSINGGGFVNITNGGIYSGATTPTLTVNAQTTNQNGFVYRVVANGVPCGGVTSNTARLTVNQPPSVVLTAASYQNITPYTRTGLYTTISPAGVYTFQWYRNGTLVPAFTKSFIDLTVDDLGTYDVVVTDVNGCSTRSNKVAVGDSASKLLFIYPNPNTGRFQVRYYSNTTNVSKRSIVVFDSRGAKVQNVEYSTSGPYGQMLVNIRNAAAGVYMIMLQDDKGNTLATGKVMIIAH